DSATAKMALAILPKYDENEDIVANSVVTTRAIGGGDLYGYTMSIQKGDNLVTNPDPGTIAELTYAAFSDPNIPPTFSTVRFATPKNDGVREKGPILAPVLLQQMETIAQTVEVAYCNFNPNYYQGQFGCNGVYIDKDKPTALDLEFKVLE